MQLCCLIKYLILRRDNIPTVLIQEWRLNADLFNGECMTGLVPSLYANETNNAAGGLQEFPEKAHADLARIQRVFFMPEVIPLHTATAIVKKPR